MLELLQRGAKEGWFTYNGRLNKAEANMGGGECGIFTTSSAYIGNITKTAEGKFTWATAPLPRMHARGRPHDQGAPRPGRGAELPHLAGQPRDQRREGAHRSRRRGGVVKIAFAKKNPPIEPPQDTKYVKHIRFRSDILSKWWGTDIYLGAIALLPEGWAEHPNARYPVIYNHGHFPRTFGGIRETPPDPRAPSRSSASRPAPTASTRTGSPARWAASSSS